MKKKYSNIIIVAVFIIGLSLLLYPTIANKWNTYRQSKLISNYDAKVAELKKDGKIDFATLPVIEMRVREILLKWLSDAMENVSFQARTEDGRRFFLDRSHMDEKCVVHCEDGNFTMPHMTIEFLEDEG